MTTTGAISQPHPLYKRDRTPPSFEGAQSRRLAYYAALRASGPTHTKLRHQSPAYASKPVRYLQGFIWLSLSADEVHFSGEVFQSIMGATEKR